MEEDAPQNDPPSFCLGAAAIGAMRDRLPFRFVGLPCVMM